MLGLTKWNKWKPKTDWNGFNAPFQFDGLAREQFTTVPNDELLLGREPDDDEFKTQVTYPYPRGRRMTIVIVGGQGTGKTVVTKNICLDQLYYRFGHPLLYIDPKLDTHPATRPNTNAIFREQLANYDLLPNQYNIYHVVPKFMNLFGARGQKITMSLQDFLPMDVDTRIATLCQILKIKTDEPAYAIISQVMNDDKLLLGTPKGFIIAMKGIMESQGIKSDRLIWKFEGLINTNKLSDEDFNYAKKMKEHGIVALEGSVGDETTIETMTQGAFVNMAIYNVVNARMNEIRRGKTGTIPYVVMEEASNFAGKGGLSAGIMTAISTRYRAINDVAGIGSVVVSQFLHELAPKIVSEAELIICPKLTDSRDLEILKDRNSNYSIFDKMHCDPNSRPNDWIGFGRNGLTDYRLFKPLPTMSEMGTA